MHSKKKKKMQFRDTCVAEEGFLSISGWIKSIMGPVDQ